MNVKDYVNKFFGIEYKGNETLEGLRNWLDGNGRSDLWDYPINEINHINEMGYTVVIVSDDKDERYFQI